MVCVKNQFATARWFRDNNPQLHYYLLYCNTNVAKFADSGIDELLKRVLAKGARRQNLIAKIAGGAKMFSVNNKSEMLSIGDRNVEASISKLKELKIPIKAQDTGETYGRTVTFFPETGQYHIKRVGKEIKII